MITIRPATVSDIYSITDIYNEAVLNTTATFDTEIKTVAERLQWFQHHGHRHPVLVAEQGGIITGWASLSKWSERQAYDTTAEESVYIHKDYRGRGIGKELLQSITMAGKELGMHTILARITAGNASSIYIHELMGYEHIGVMRQVGIKFDQLLDVHMMQKLF